MLSVRRAPTILDSRRPSSWRRRSGRSARTGHVRDARIKRRRRCALAKPGRCSAQLGLNSSSDTANAWARAAIVRSYYRASSGMAFSRVGWIIKVGGHSTAPDHAAPTESRSVRRLTGTIATSGVRQRVVVVQIFREVPAHIASTTSPEADPGRVHRLDPVQRPADCGRAPRPRRRH